VVDLASVTEITKELRVAAYAVCLDDGKVLLVRWVGPEGPRWTLPGGGVDHAEDTVDAAVREVEEETGHVVEVETLLGLNTIRRHFPRGPGVEADFHGLRVIYAARVVGGTLRNEVGGSTDLAAWVSLDEIAGLDRVDLVDVGLELHRLRPRDGKLPNRVK
jgi:ADP-ribose pyrophosphatase YjhB (NUDIX family)